MFKAMFKKTKVQIALGTLFVETAMAIIMTVAPSSVGVLEPLVIIVAGFGLSLIGTHTATDITALIKASKK